MWRWKKRHGNRKDIIFRKGKFSKKIKGKEEEEEETVFSLLDNMKIDRDINIYNILYLFWSIQHFIFGQKHETTIINNLWTIDFLLIETP